VNERSREISAMTTNVRSWLIREVRDRPLP
jgi:hypothetical protein